MDTVTLEIIDGPDYNVDEDGWEHHAYMIELRYQGRKARFPWRSGLGITEDPTASDVLECLLSDASSIDNARDFEDWVSDYGYDPDSRKAYKIYQAVEAQTKKLERLLGSDYQSVVFPEDYDQERAVKRMTAA